MTVRASQLAGVACVAIAFFVGVGYGRARTERAVAMAVKAARAKAANAKPAERELEPRTHYRAGKVVGRDLYDPKTGTVTVLPIVEPGSTLTQTATAEGDRQ